MVCRNVDKLQKQKVNFLDKNEATLKKKDKKQTRQMFIWKQQICKNLTNIVLLLLCFLFNKLQTRFCKLSLAMK